MNNKNQIKVGFCVAYDWELLKISLPLVYDNSDLICCSLDKNRRSWSGERYIFNDDAFISFINQIDVQKKIILYEDDFSLNNLSPIENDNRQRNMMASKMGEGGWHIQIDSDEYILEFEKICSFLKNKNIHQKELNYSIFLIPVIKKLDDGYLVVQFDDQLESVPLITNKPLYLNARRNGYFNKLIPFVAIHETWSRDEATLLKKINSWGHVHDFNKESYFKLWQSLDEYNYQFVKNIHPIQPEAWPKLAFIPAKNMFDLIEHYQNNPPKISSSNLLFRNSRFISRIKSHLKLKR